MTTVDRDVVHVLGCPIDRLGMQATVERCRELIDEGRFVQQVSVNAAKLVALQEDSKLRSIVTGCDVISADGQSVVWASRLLGQALPERVAGIDLMEKLLELAETQGYRVYFLGATDDVLARAIDRIRREHPRLQIAGARNGYFDADEEPGVRREIRQAEPHILFVAMSSPRKEYWLADNAPDLGVRLAIGVGGSLDVVAGHVRRAPTWIRRLGFEWLFRLAQEPRRLWRRYLTSNTAFLLLLVRSLIRRAADREA